MLIDRRREPVKRELLVPKPLKMDQPRPHLEMTRIPVFRVHYRTLEQFIVEVYRSNEVDFLAAAGAVPGLVPEFKVTGVLPQGRDWDKRIDWIKRGGPACRYAYLLLDLLAYEGYIPRGQYIIDTSPAPNPIEFYKQTLLEEQTPLGARCVNLKQRYATVPGFTKQAAAVDSSFLAQVSA